MGTYSQLSVTYLLLVLACIPTSWSQSFTQHPLGAVPFEFRDPKVEDAGDIATVLIDAFSQAPVWHYVHQFEDDFPGHIWGCIRKNIISFFDHDGPNKPTIKVIAVLDETSQSGSRVVSFSNWNFNRTRANAMSLAPIWSFDNGNCSQQPDVNKTRSDHYLSHLANLETYLDDAFEQQVYLAGLATHPKWDGNGFAAHHLDWGMGLADSMGLPTTLISTAAGYPLYKSKGFEDFYNGTLERLDGLGIIWHEVMKYSAYTAGIYKVQSVTVLPPAAIASSQPK